VPFNGSFISGDRGGLISDPDPAQPGNAGMGEFPHRSLNDEVKHRSRRPRVLQSGAALPVQ